MDQEQMGQEQINILPTALCWDGNGELCSDIFQCLIDRLQSTGSQFPESTSNCSGQALIGLPSRSVISQHVA
jgi:hypothetical protein